MFLKILLSFYKSNVHSLERFDIEEMSQYYKDIFTFAQCMWEDKNKLGESA